MVDLETQVPSLLLAPTKTSRLLGNLMFRRRYPSFPVIFRSHMFIQGHLLTGSSIKVLSIGPTLHRVPVPEQISGPELGQQKVDDVLE